jgi:hypothetical protein
MARRSHRQRRGRNGDQGKKAVGIALITASLAAVIAGGYFFATAQRSPALAKDTLCPVEGPRSATVILLDTSDPLPDVTRQEALKYLMDTAESLPAYGLMEIRLLDPSVPGGRQVFSKCNPGDGSGLSEYTANPAMARKRWTEGFRQPIEKAMTAALAPTDAKTSPIMETVQRIAVDRFSGKAAADMPKSLIVMSDMIEHGPGYSQYQGDLSYGRFKATEAYRRFHTDLQGASVSLYYIQRLAPKRINSAEHIQFWMDWVKDNNGRLTEATKLQGAG